jgi:hypothetical protein
LAVFVRDAEDGLRRGVALLCQGIGGLRSSVVAVSTRSSSLITPMNSRRFAP